MAKLLTGKEVSAALVDDLAPRIERLSAVGVTPTLAIVRVGVRPDDLSYERTACKRAEALGLAVRRFELPADAPQGELEAVIDAVNADDGIHGCLMFRPLPPSMDERAVCDRLAPEKDIDGIGSASLVEGKRVVVLGRSLVIGRPVAMMLLARHATVTLAHSRTADAAAHTREADIVVCATGRARAFGPEYFAPGQTVLDVGINFDEAGNLCGDVDFDAVESVLGPEGAITPVPRGLGGVTTTVTMAHVVQAAEAGQR